MAHNCVIIFLKKIVGRLDDLCFGEFRLWKLSLEPEYYLFKQFLFDQFLQNPLPWIVKEGVLRICWYDPIDGLDSLSEMLLLTEPADTVTNILLFLFFEAILAEEFGHHFDAEKSILLIELAIILHLL